MSAIVRLHVALDDSNSLAYQEANRCIVGRGVDCHIQIPNRKRYARISKYHCMFEINPPQICVRDFGSMNGTFVNGEKVGQRLQGQDPNEAQKKPGQCIGLKHGDLVSIGDGVTIKIVIEINAFCQNCHVPIALKDQTRCERTPDTFICPRCWKKNLRIHR